MFFDRPESGERAVLVHLELEDDPDQEDLREFEELALSAGADPVVVVSGSRIKPNPRFFVGEGKLEELRQVVAAEDAQLLLFNHALSPGQERNLERELRCRVLDRTGLILDIFAQRARTHEGKLQVELAQLQHLSTRLIRGWTHLERQKGGIGLRGPGETQLETDRRLIRIRIRSITERLEKVRKQRDQSRRLRQRSDIPTISLVGYTNAGKSTLFNRITEADVYAADQLFATLDPTLRKLDLADSGTVVFADTVGFIRHLPHKLVEAFRATLQETSDASLLLHVVDASSEEREDNIDQVDAVLREIGAAEIQTLVVYNKIDQIQGSSPRLERDDEGVPRKVWISAKTGDGIELLLGAIDELTRGEMLHMNIELPPSLGRLRSRLYALDAVVKERSNAEGHLCLEIRIQKRHWLKTLSRLELDGEQIAALDVNSLNCLAAH